ncbi:MAG TPA: TetR family transcriptional regulator, partial [Chthoniobacterales bacterium]
MKLSVPLQSADPRAETRQAILDAAEQLFASSGVHGTSVRDITKAAGVNLGSIN